MILGMYLRGIRRLKAQMEVMEKYLEDDCKKTPRFGTEFIPCVHGLGSKPIP